MTLGIYSLQKDQFPAFTNYRVLDSTKKHVHPPLMWESVESEDKKVVLKAPGRNSVFDTTKLVNKVCERGCHIKDINETLKDMSKMGEQLVLIISFGGLASEKLLLALS